MAIVEHEVGVRQDVRLVQVDEVGQALLNAADVLRRDGWCQGESRDPQGRHCALGALMEAGSVTAVMRGGVRLKRSLGLEDTSVAFWNDRPERTKEQVIEALERAAYGV